MQAANKRRRVVILGAAGRDFHNFNMLYREEPAVEVVAFTAAQIPGIGGRAYPPALAGPLYPFGIPVRSEAELERIVAENAVDEVDLAYSDLAHEDVMHLASRALASGADFVLRGPGATMLDANRPVIAVSAVRTGCGKSQVTRYISQELRARGLRVAAIRHPMPYGDLERQAVQRFATIEEIGAADCTLEEREEYEPHVAAGSVVYAGIDYARILAAAEAEADIVLWDGGNNDFPFLRPDLHIVLADALRPGHETAYHPGETVLRMADIVVIAKSDAARRADIEAVRARIEAANPAARIVLGASPVKLDDTDAVKGKRALVVEDGPTITHGGAATGAGYLAARQAGAAGIVDPRTHAAPRIREVYARYPHIGPVLPAMGYDEAQVEALRETIEASGADLVVAGTPIDLTAAISLTRPVVRARYDYADYGEPRLGDALDAFLARVGLNT